MVEIKNSSTARKEELARYQILDSGLDLELDELCRLAANICNTSIALVSLLDDEQQWFIAKYGTDLTSTPIDISFCRHALKTPTELFIVKDATQEERFKSNPLVLGSPHIKFYAGASLISPNKVAIGTLCVISSEAMDLDDNQKAALKILSRRIMHHIDSRSTINAQQKSLEGFARKLQKITDYAPSILFEYRFDDDNQIVTEFISKGVELITHGKIPEGAIHDLTSFSEYLTTEDFMQLLERAYEANHLQEPWSSVFPVNFSDGTQLWFEMKASPEPDAGGSIHWYGAVHDVTAQVEYEKVLEDIAFDISHVLRRPVSTTLGLLDLIQASSELDPEQLHFYADNARKVAEELDTFTRKLNDAYSERKRKIIGSKVAKKRSSF